MDFFNSAVEVPQTLVVALGAGLAIWGAINLLEGYGNDYPARMLMCHKVTHQLDRQPPTIPCEKQVINISLSLLTITRESDIFIT